MVSWGPWIYVIYVEFISCEVIRGSISYGSSEEKDIVSKWAGHCFMWTEISRAKSQTILCCCKMKENVSSWSWWIYHFKERKKKKRPLKPIKNHSLKILPNGLFTLDPLIFKLPRCFSRFKFLMQLAPVPKASIDFLAGIGAGFAEAGGGNLLWMTCAVGSDDVCYPKKYSKWIRFR